jgi:hypothetical protein
VQTSALQRAFGGDELVNGRWDILRLSPAQLNLRSAQ